MEKESEREREGEESTIVAPKISARKATGHCSPVTESAIYWHSWVVEVRKSCGRRNEGRGITSSLVISSTTSFLPGNLHLASPAHLRAKRIRYIVVSCNKDQYIPELKFFRDRGTLSSLYAFMLNHISLRIVLLHLRFKRYKRQPRSQLSRKQTTLGETRETTPRIDAFETKIPPHSSSSWNERAAGSSSSASVDVPTNYGDV